MISDTVTKFPVRQIRMNTKLRAVAWVSLLTTCRAVAQTPAENPNASIDGVWQCGLNGLPAVTLVVTDEPGVLTGAILFYFQQRATERDAYSTVPGLPEPIFHPRFDGKTLLFEVSHRRSHPPRTLKDPPKHFRLTLRDSDTAELVNSVDEPGTACKVVRSDH